MKVGDLSLDTGTMVATRGNHHTRLRAKEFAILKYMMENPEIVLSRSKIIANIWSVHADPSLGIIDVYINRIRTKIDKSFDIKLIKTIHGIGYKYSTQPL